uniref:Uncharacterized protein n=1 Tax=Oryza punctata TaxID=4537 RepID=A0A0E0LFJ9_ORYPU
MTYSVACVVAPDAVRVSAIIVSASGRGRWSSSLSGKVVVGEGGGGHRSSCRRRGARRRPCPSSEKWSAEDGGGRCKASFSMASQLSFTRHAITTLGNRICSRMAPASTDEAVAATNLLARDRLYAHSRRLLPLPPHRLPHQPPPPCGARPRTSKQRNTPHAATTSSSSTLATVALSTVTLPATAADAVAAPISHRLRLLRSLQAIPTDHPDAALASVVDMLLCVLTDCDLLNAAAQLRSSKDTVVCTAKPDPDLTNTVEYPLAFMSRESMSNLGQCTVVEDVELMRMRQAGAQGKLVADDDWTRPHFASHRFGARVAVVVSSARRGGPWASFVASHPEAHVVGPGIVGPHVSEWVPGRGCGGRSPEPHR